MTWTPFAGDGWLSRLKFLPEARIDYATKPAFDGLTSQSQFTIAIELLHEF